MINTFIIEILILLFACIVMNNLLSLNRSKRIKIAIIFAIKFIVFNPLSTYLRFAGYEKEPYTYWTGLANIMLILILLALSRIVTRVTYTVLVGVFTVFIDILSAALFMVPYELVTSKLMKKGPIFFGEDFDIKVLLIYLGLLAFFVVVIIIAYVLTNKFKEKIIRFINKAKIVVWAFFIVDIGIGTASFIVKAKWYVIVYYVIAIALGVLIMYGASLYVRRKLAKDVEATNYVLNTENETIKKYYDDLYSQLEEDKQFRHDIDKHMNVIKEMVDEGASEKEIKQYAESIKETYK